MVNAGGSSPLWFDSTPRQVMLGCIKEQVERAMESKPVKSFPPRYVFQTLGEFLPCLPSVTDLLPRNVNQASPFFLRWILFSVLILAIEPKPGQKQQQKTPDADL